MDTIIGIVLAAVISGLGFLCYREPQKAKIILKVIALAGGFCFSVIAIYYIGRVTSLMDIYNALKNNGSDYKGAISITYDISQQLFKSTMFYVGLTVFGILVFYFLANMFSNVEDPVTTQDTDKTE